MRPDPKGYRDRAVSLYSTLYTVHCTDEQHAMSSHELQKCTDVKGGIFENVLY
jgi:hypothetical protein